MIEVSDLALEKIQEILKEEPAGTVIRVNVKPG
jgi:Fe-S cluster assembly iron-binding protein IscA